MSDAENDSPIKASALPDGISSIFKSKADDPNLPHDIRLKLIVAVVDDALAKLETNKDDPMAKEAIKWGEKNMRKLADSAISAGDIDKGLNDMKLVKDIEYAEFAGPKIAAPKP